MLAAVKQTFRADPAGFFTTAFIVLLFAVFPCFVGVEGYANITGSKFWFLLIASLCYFVGLLFCGLGRWRQNKSSMKEAVASAWRGSSLTQKLLLVYALLVLLSTICSAYPQLAWWGGIRHEGMVTLLLYLGIFMAVSAYGRFKPLYLYALLISLTVNILLSLIQFGGANPLGLYPAGLNYFDGNSSYSGEFLGTIGNSGLLTAFFCLAIPAFIIYFIRREGDRRAYALLAVAIAALAVMWRSGVAAGAVALLVTLLAVLPLLLPSRKARLIYLILLLILLAAGIVFLSLADIAGDGMLAELAAVLQGQTDDSLGSSRIAIWRETLNLIGEQPLLGGGPATLGERLDLVFSRETAAGTYSARVDVAHNDYLNIAVNSGIPAALVYLLALIVSCAGWIKYRQQRAVLVCGAAVLCYSVQIFFSYSLCITAPLFWIFWGLLDNSLKRQRQQRLLVINKKRP